MPPSSANDERKGESRPVGVGAGADARSSAGGGAIAARGGAVTAPLTATSIVAARASPPKPFAAVTTPARFPNAPFNVSRPEASARNRFLRA